jgi:hypothetical protein
VLTATVRFEGWTTETWTRFLSLWKPRAEPEREATRVRGGLVVLHEGPRVLKVIHLKRGRLEPNIAWPTPLADLAEQHAASWVLSLERGTLEEVMEQFGARARRHDDVITQSISLVNIVREKMLAGEIEFWPARLDGIPVPTDAMVRRALDSVCEDEHCMVLGLFQDGELWTAMCGFRRGYGLDVIAGPEDLRLNMGLLSGDWRRDYRHLVRVVEETYGPLSFGCFAEVDTFRRLQVDPTPGAWSKAVALRDIVVSPVPGAVGLALGLDGARFAFENVRQVTERVDRFGLLDPFMQGLRKRAGAVLGDQDVTRALGFSPMEVLRLLLKR